MRRWCARVEEGKREKGIGKRDGVMHSELRKKTAKRVAPNEPKLRASGRPGMGTGRKDEGRKGMECGMRIKQSEPGAQATGQNQRTTDHESRVPSHRKAQWPNEPKSRATVRPVCRTGRMACPRQSVFGLAASPHDRHGRGALAHCSRAVARSVRITRRRDFAARRSFRGRLRSVNAAAHLDGWGWCLGPAGGMMDTLRFRVGTHWIESSQL